MHVRFKETRTGSLEWEQHEVGVFLNGLPWLLNFILLVGIVACTRDCLSDRRTEDLVSLEKVGVETVSGDRKGGPPPNFQVILFLPDPMKFSHTDHHG